MTQGVRLVVLGKQGSGKGTQCVRLSNHYAVPHISTGDMLRANVSQGTELGLLAKSIMDAGNLLSDEIIMDMVGERLKERNVSARGFILDGCPRTIRQAELLAEKLEPKSLDLAVLLDVPTELVLERIASRLTCSDCGAIYSTHKPPLVPGICNTCGGVVRQRKDDTVESVKVRLAAFEAETAPLVGWYGDRGLLVTVDGNGPEDEVMTRIVAVIEANRGAA